MDYKDLHRDIHQRVCNFIQDDRVKRKDLELPRGYLKTSTCNIGKNIWRGAKNPKIRILIASNVAENAEKMVAAVRWHWEKNSLLKALYPEAVPEYSRVKWSDRSAVLNGHTDGQVGTYESIGCGGSAVSRHFDAITEDDLIYAKKDDLAGGELRPSQADIEKAIGWHKLVYSLLVNQKTDVIDNIGTRWDPKDLKWYIRRYEPYYKTLAFNVHGQFDPRIARSRHRSGPSAWMDRYDENVLMSLQVAQGPYMYSTQYLGDPIDPSEKVFDEQWIQYYTELPKGLTFFTTIDLSGWKEGLSGKSTGKSAAVVLTCGVDQRGHLWLARYDRGKFTPTKILDLMWAHWRQFGVRMIGIEEVYYQKSIRHFANKRMDDEPNKYERIKVKQLKTSTHISKDARIRALEPLAFTGGIHARKDMGKFRDEFVDYRPGILDCDILDALAYQLQIARPDLFEQEFAADQNPLLFDNIIDEIESRARRKDDLASITADLLSPTELVFNG